MNTQLRRFARAAGHLATAGLIAACSAPAHQSTVPGSSAGPVLRSDQFQAAAAHGARLVVVGNNGVVLSSTDTGEHWRRSQVAADAALIGVAACPDGHFAALDFGGRVWSGSGEPEAWQARPLDEPRHPLAITCDAAGRLWVVGSDSTIARSDDDGASWHTTVVGDDANLATVQFVDERHGFVTGEFGFVYHTDDGGESWREAGQVSPEFYPFAAHFADTERGWISGLAGVVVETRDGGASWAKSANPAAAPTYGLVDQSGALLGVGVNGLVFRQRDGEWKLLAARPTGYLRAALPLADGRLLLAGGGTLEIARLSDPQPVAQASQPGVAR